MEPDLADGADREELEVAPRTPSRVRILGRLLVPAALAPALVNVARHQARSAHRPPEDVFELSMLLEHLAVAAGEDEIGG
jgi:hypothetical protein